MSIIGSNRPFEIENCSLNLSKETHPTKVVIVFLEMSPQSVQKASIFKYWTTLDINWTEKYQLHHVPSSCWFDLQIPILFPMHICFQFFWEKICFYCTSVMTINAHFLHLQSWNVVQMKAIAITFSSLWLFFQCHTTHG